MAIRLFLCLFVIFCLETAAGNLTLTTSPKEISLGLTETLMVNCTFTKDGDNSDMAALISFFISRHDSNDTSNSVELASINSYIPHVNIILPEFNSSSGKISPSGGVSYLELTWIYPTDLQRGVYVCSAQGIDDVGHTVSLSALATVTARLPEREEILAKIKELMENVKTQEQKFSELYSNLSANFYQFAGSQSKHNDDVNKTLSVLEAFQKEVDPLVALFQQSLFYPFNFTYGSHVYRVLRAPVWGVDDAVALCESYGATLLEIDDVIEYQKVETFLNQHPRLTAIPVGGRLVDHSWLKQYNDREMFDEISFHVPLNYSVTNGCLILAKNSDWGLQAVPCQEIQLSSLGQQVNAVCESTV